MSRPAASALLISRSGAAARRALAQGAPDSAVGDLDRARREPPAKAERAAVLAELGRGEAIAGRPKAVSHLEAAIELVPDPRERGALLLEFGRELHHAGRVSEASASFRRGLDELGAGERSELAGRPGGWLLTSAMHTRELAADAHARAHE
jgi:tetratricopeptide (TPR) repeat protein